MGAADIRHLAGAVPVKIVWFIDHLRPDGTQRVLTQLVAGLSAHGHSQAVVCLNDSWDQAILNELHSSGCEVRIIGKAALLTGTGIYRTWRWLRAERFDAAVTLLFYSDVVGRTLAHAAGVPRVVTYIQARNTNYTFWQRWCVRRTMRWADRVVVCSRSLSDYAIEAEGATEGKVSVIPHGIRVNGVYAPPENQSLRSELHIPVDCYLIGSLGRLTYQKGYDILLDALARMPEENVHVLMAGTGEMLPSLQAQAAGLGIAERVHWVGYRRDVPRILQDIDIYVQPSRFEGMPNAVLEAMAAERPIVASAVDGHCELIEDGISGWLVPGENPAATARALSEGLIDWNEAFRRGKEARRRALDLYSLDKMVAGWEDLLES